MAIALIDFINQVPGGPTTRRWQRAADRVYQRLEILRGRAPEADREVFVTESENTS